MGYLDSEGLEKQIQYIKSYVRGELQKHASVPIGFEYFSVNPNIPQGSLPLFGGEYSRETYADLWAWVQEQTGYWISEGEWQTLSTSNNGNVPFYSSGDGSTTFRVPSLKCWVKGANGTVTEVGSYKAAGLPNITGVVTETMGGSEPKFKSPSGAFAGITSVAYYSQTTNNNSSSRWDGVNFNASRSSSIYGNSATVQPESIVGMWLVKAYGTVEDTGTIDEQQYIDDRIAALPTSLSTTFLPLAGGEMSGDINYSSPVMQDTSGSVTNPSDYKCLMSKYGTKGTLPDSSNYKCAILPLAVSRDTSDLINNDTKCRYACIENLVWADGGNNLSFRVYKNGADETDSVQFYIDYGTTSGDEKQLVFDGKRIDVKAVGTNYIRYGNGVQICWGSAASSNGIFTITFPVAFANISYGCNVTGLPASTGTGASRMTSLGTASGMQTTTSWTGTIVNASNALQSTSVVYIAIGKWK